MSRTAVPLRTGLVENEQILLLAEGLKNAQETIIELEAQRDEALRLLHKTRVKLLEYNALFPSPATQTNNILPKPTNTPLLEAENDDDWILVSKPANTPLLEASNDWILGSWCACNGPMAEAESLCRHKHWQQALAKLDHMLAQKSNGPKEMVDCRLLKAIVLGQLNMLQDAIACCEEALRWATTYQLYEMRGKSQFHLGILYYENGQLLEARVAFGMATFTRGYKHQVEAWKEHCDADLKNLYDPNSTEVHVSSSGRLEVRTSAERARDSNDVKIEALERVWNQLGNFTCFVDS